MGAGIALLCCGVFFWMGFSVFANKSDLLFRVLLRMVSARARFFSGTEIQQKRTPLQGNSSTCILLCLLAPVHQREQLAQSELFLNYASLDATAFLRENTRSFSCPISNILTRDQYKEAMGRL